MYHPRAKEKTIPPAPQKTRWLRRWKEHLAWVYPFFPTETLESQRHESKELLDGPGREPLACLLPFHHSSLHLRNKRRAHFPEGGELLSEITRRWRSRMAFRRPPPGQRPVAWQKSPVSSVRGNCAAHCQGPPMDSELCPEFIPRGQGR